ncbi:hypothetical protein HBA55_16920 [Pseudomaricurvus alkylphenolicus]|jgi:cell division inhibitor SulA|uniref:SulA-like leucine-rich domain-containing protein n=1 Tax=Pseudomaricurvus alkylphenolicus TaxID=1306991 RepID=UPI001420811D|nr:SulA-like leucine-rich domain-containing protein [Pseudomaricurvus alkylphenolicus]NIB41287.1 hypothetical protein [Pseudomaricurvus alkylphenolicus]
MNAHQTVQQPNMAHALAGAQLHDMPLQTTKTAPRKESSITELVLTKHSPDEVMLLLPVIAHLSRISDRWITWVVDSKIDRKLLDSYGVQSEKIRLIYSSEEEDNRWLVWEALNAGTSHTVIANNDVRDEATMAYMEEAATNGNSRGLFLRYR